MEIVQKDTTIRRNSIFLMPNYNATLAERIQKLYPDARIEHIDMNGPRRAGGEFDVIIFPEATAQPQADLTT
jgi:hypothetical protein